MTFKGNALNSGLLPTGKARDFKVFDAVYADKACVVEMT